MSGIYAGIGSRKTPEEILLVMKKIAKYLEKQNYVLHSGGAIGADRAFESGTNIKIIFKPENVSSEALNFSKKYHPNWNACSEYAKKLHARNAYIVLGSLLNDPVDFIICWTEKGQIKGGTGQALRIAKDYKIKVYNLAIIEDLNFWLKK